MEPELLKFDECMDNIHLFSKWEGISGLDGRFINYVNGKVHCFIWRSDCNAHRIKGPAVIFHKRVSWYFLGDKAPVRNQCEFDKWIAKKILEV